MGYPFILTPHAALVLGALMQSVILSRMDLSRRTRLHPSTLYPLLSRLEQAGVLVRDEDTNSSGGSHLNPGISYRITETGASQVLLMSKVGKDLAGRQ